METPFDKLMYRMQKYTEKTLIIIDNYNYNIGERRLQFENFIIGNYKVLLTTKNAQVSNYIKIEELNNKSILLELFEIYYKPQIIKNNELDDVQYLISDVAYGHTFAIELIATTMRYMRINAKEMRENLSQGITTEVNYNIPLRKQDYPDTIETKPFYMHLSSLFDMSAIINNVDLGKNAILILQILTLFAKPGIDIDVFYDYAIKKNIEKDKFRYILNTLIELGWIHENVNDRIISMHNIASDVISSNMLILKFSNDELIKSIFSNKNNITSKNEFLEYISYTKTIINNENLFRFESKRLNGSCFDYPYVVAFNDETSMWNCYMPDLTVYAEGETKSQCVEVLLELVKYYYDLAKKHNTDVPLATPASEITKKWKKYEIYLLSDVYTNIMKSREPDEEFALLIGAASQGDPDAQYKLGKWYTEGDGVPDDLKKAVELYEKAASQGHIIAHYEIGFCYENGEGVKRDLVKSIEWHEKAAIMGYVQSQNIIGIAYKDGKGVIKDLIRAIEWYEKAADQGYAAAQSNLALCYKNGEGVLQNIEKAVDWFMKAANQGEPEAQYNLGLSYMNGEGVVQDLAIAIEFFKKAANQGNVFALYNLGLCYENGDGVTKDLLKAVELYKKASVQGHELAKEAIVRIESKNKE